MKAPAILWLCLSWMPILVYVMLRNETKFKKNIVVGVTFPQEGREDEAVLALLKGFKATQLLLCLGLVALAAAGALLPLSFGWSMTIWLVWADLCVLLPYLPYIRCNRALRRLKAERGWARQGQGQVTVDLRSAVEPMKELGFVHFLLPALVSLLPCLWALWAGDRSYGLTMLMNPALVLLMWVLYRYAFRRKSEMVDENTDLTRALTRLRRQYWRRMCLWTAWFIAAFALCMWLGGQAPFLATILMALLTLALVIFVMQQEFHLRKMQEKLTAKSGVGSYVDEDDKWIWGLFYYDPNDSRLIVNNRVGGNTTVNLARPVGKVFMGLSAALLLFLPLMGVWMVQMEQTPVEVSIQAGSLTARHMGTHYQISLEDIEEAALLTQEPSLYKVVGTEMDGIYKGTFRSGELGTLTVCMAPGQGPYLLVVTEGESYLFSTTQAGQIETVYRQLEGYEG